MRLEHRQHHGQAARVPADDGAARRAEGASARPAPGSRPGAAACPPCRRRRRCPASPRSRPARNSSDGFGTSARPRSVISKTPISSVGPKRFLTARRMRKWWPRVALEGDDRVDHVLDHARAGDLAVLGDVADEDHGRAGRLGEADQGLGAAAHLRDGAGRRFDRLGPHGLDRIDDGEGRGLALREGGDDVLDIGLGGELDRRARRGRGARRAGAPAPPPPRPRCRRPGGRRRRARPRPGSGASTCRCRDRRRSG